MSGAGLDPSALLRAVAHALEECELAGRRVEDLVADLVDAAPPDPRIRRELQELDLLVQKIRDLAAFCHVLGHVPELDRPAMKTALDVLRLEEMRAILSGRPMDTPPAGVDLF